MGSVELDGGDVAELDRKACHVLGELARDDIGGEGGVV